MATMQTLFLWIKLLKLLHSFPQTLAENDRDKISIILAGYEDDMNRKLFSFNEGKSQK